MKVIRDNALLRRASKWFVKDDRGFAIRKKKIRTSLQAIATIRSESNLYSDEKYVDILRDEAIALHDSPSPLIEVRSSTISEAGRGIFATSNLKAGTLVGTYGGKYFPPIPICGSCEPLFDEPQLLIDIKGEYVICCEGGGWIDGKYSLQKTEGRHCVMQLVNHSSRPNSTSVTISKFPSGLGLSTPPAGTPWYFSPQDASTISLPKQISMKGPVLVTLRNIAEGEELFYDYGLNPPEHRPEWYEAVEENYLDTLVADAR